MTARGCRGDRGSGAVWVLTVLALAWLAAGAALLRGQAVGARHVAGGAADLAALAAADRLVEGEAVACGAARRVAAAQHTRVTACRVDGDAVEVSVEVAVPGPLALVGPATARARAGPASATDTPTPPAPEVRPAASVDVDGSRKGQTGDCAGVTPGGSHPGGRGGADPPRCRR